MLIDYENSTRLKLQNNDKRPVMIGPEHEYRVPLLSNCVSLHFLTSDYLWLIMILNFHYNIGFAGEISEYALIVELFWCIM